MYLISFLVKEFKFNCIVAILFGLFSGAGGAGIVAVINKIIVGNNHDQPSLLLSFVAYLFLLLIGTYGSNIYMAKISQEILYKVRMNLMKGMIELPYPKVEKTGADKMLAALTGDVETLGGALVAIPGVIISGSVILGCLIYLSFLSFYALLLMVMTLMFIVVGYYLITRKGIKRFIIAREIFDWLVSHYKTLTIGAKELKLDNKISHTFFEQDIKKTAKNLQKTYFSALMSYATAITWSQVVLFSMLASLIYFEMTDVISREIFVAFSLTLLYLMGPINHILSTVDFLTQGAVSLRKIKSLDLDIDSTTTSLNNLSKKPKAKEFENSPIELSLESIEYQYNNVGVDKGFKVGPINIALKQSGIYYFIGGNGSGKTTLLKILCGLYEPTQGTLNTNGVIVNSDNASWYQNKIAAIFSDFHIWYRQIEGYDPKSTLVTEVQKEFSLQDYDLWNENFWRPHLPLSQGQKRRVAMLIALLQDKPIYIFDEWAADQDPYFKHYFYKRLLPDLKRKNKLVIVVTHDDKYFSDADKVFKIEDGKINEHIV